MTEPLGSRPTEWAGKTYSEITDLAGRDGSILVVPVGSVEQHGHHLPVATDTILVDAVAHLGATRVVDDLPVLVTPPVWTGHSPHHRSLGGTLSLGHEDLLGALEGVAETALENGFDALLFCNGHGGNASLVSSVTGTVGVDHPDVEVLGVTYFHLASSFIDDLRESDVGGMAHAGEFETALMLHLRPELVDTDRMEAEELESEYSHGLHDMFDAGPLTVYREFREYSASGAIGAPELATAEQGERLFERLGDELELVLREAHERVR
ncbi:creatininase family protein [Halomarina oriensis]|uniref:Creatininase family protein n=1 Tax=Halomarina oriensis TaxID=671145 RepID=A0A6B0GNC0_9EURY|nr:creatininase family protein [Halomarina oriensis]MWG34999.1 creatininase family protein [Halomarina oriensis]